MNKYCKIYLDSLVKIAAPGDRGEYGQGVDLDEKYQNLAKLNTTVKQVPSPVATIGELATKPKPAITQPAQKTQDKGIMPDTPATRKLLGIPAGYKPGEADLNDVAGYK